MEGFRGYWAKDGQGVKWWLLKLGYLLEVMIIRES